MLRLRFLPGLMVGLFIGIPLGVFLVLTLSRPSDLSGSASEVQDLKARLDRTERDKEVLNRQVEEFSGLADRMKNSFGELEQRFKGLEEELHLREATQPPSVASATPQAPTLIPSAATPESATP